MNPGKKKYKRFQTCGDLWGRGIGDVETKQKQQWVTMRFPSESFLLNVAPTLCQCDEKCTPADSRHKNKQSMLELVQ